MFSLMQKTYFKQSIEFGDFVQDQFRERAQRKDLGVREQGILVLAQTSMPGVLVETGFITNADEEKYLMSKYGQEIIASAIYRGFKEYKEEIDRRSNLSVVVSESPPKEETEAEKAAEEPVSSSWQETVMASVSGAAPVLFRVQVSSSKNKIAPEPSLFKGYKEVKVIEDGRWYKYLVGEKSSYHEALDLCKEVKKDYPDAFVVASKNQKIIPLKTALEEINR
jgi:N-acetylmuramoyl-L-alanine amidase